MRAELRGLTQHFSEPHTQKIRLRIAKKTPRVYPKIHWLMNFKVKTN